MRTLISGIAVAVALSACSSDDTNAQTGGDPVAQCNAWLDLACGVMVSCDPTGDTDTIAHCRAAVVSVADCSKAVGVSATYEQCLDDLRAMSCPPAGVDFTLPSSCSKVIKVAQQ